MNADGDLDSRHQQILEQLVDISRHVLPDMLHSMPESIRAKDGNAQDPVTEVDEAIENYLRNRLNRLFPFAEVFGEESFTAIQEIEQPGFLIDPIDGTLNFALGVGAYGTSVCYFEAGLPKVGLVHEAATGNSYWAVAGRGAFKNGSRIGIGKGLSPVCCSSGFITRALELNPDILSRILRRNGKLRLFGSQALQLCYAAEGGLSLVVNLEAKVWDDAAGCLILHEAGGSHSLAFEGDLFPLNKDGGAVRGRSIFSVAGIPDKVAEVIEWIHAAGSVEEWLSAD